jgi:hypothetical protein
MSGSTPGKFLYFSALFLAIFFLFSQHKYYPPSKLVVEGEYSSPVKVELSWRTGKKTGTYERKQHTLGETGKGTPPYKTTDSLDIAQLRVRQLKLVALDGSDSYVITSLKIVRDDGAVLYEDAPNRTLPLKVKRAYEKTGYRHPVMLVVQALLALLISGLLLAAYARLRSKGMGVVGGLTAAASEHRAFLWLFGFFMFAFTLWLLGQWPGAVNADTIGTITQARTLQFGLWQTLVYPLYALAVMQFHNSPSSIAAFQILASSLIGAFIFSACMKRGLRSAFVLPFAALFAFSIPVGLYNIYIVKDVPFALLAAIIAAGTYFLLYDRMYRKEKRKWTTLQTALVILVAVLAGTIRHNGVLYFLAVPLVLLAGRQVSWRRAACIFLIALSMFAFVQKALPSLLHVRNNWPRIETTGLTFELNPLVALFKAPWYYTDDREGDLAILGKAMDPGTMMELYRAEAADYIVFHPDYKGWDLPQKDLDNIRGLYIKRIPYNLPVFFADRAVVFFNAMGFPCDVYTSTIFTNLLDIEGYPRTHSSVTDIELSPVSWKLYTLQQKIMEWSGLVRYDRGVTEFELGMRFWVWTSLIPLTLLLAAFISYKYAPCTAASSLMLLTQVPPVFLFAPTGHFRYYYFIYFFGYFVFPLLLLELSNRDGLRAVLNKSGGRQ